MKKTINWYEFIAAVSYILTDVPTDKKKYA